MAAVTVDAERAALVEEWVYATALEDLVNNVIFTDVGDPEFIGDWPEIQNQATRADRLFDLLWPTDEAANGAESLEAFQRSTAVTAAVFSMLASDAGRDFCARRAAHFATLAAKAEW